MVPSASLDALPSNATAWPAKTVDGAQANRACGYMPAMKKSSVACAVCPALSVTVSVTRLIPCLTSRCELVGPVLSGVPSFQFQRYEVIGESPSLAVPSSEAVDPTNGAKPPPPSLMTAVSGCAAPG